MINKIKIGNKLISTGRTFIIAELSCNHRNSLDIAIKTVEEAARIGVDALKAQTMLPETMTIDCDNKYFTIQSGTLWDGRTFFDLYKEAALPFQWHYPIKKRCDELGLIFFSSPFGQGFGEVEDPISLLEKLEVPCYKIASFEIVDIPFIRRIAKLQKPIIISTGIAEYQDIKLAVETCRNEGNNDIILLKCTSSYPASVDNINLLNMKQIQEDFNCLVGVSDHSLDNEVAIASVAIGGCVIEKHFILDKSLGGPDADFSLDPNEFKSLVDSVRITDRILGRKDYILSDKVKKNKIFSRSLFAVQNIKEGDFITDQNIRSIRPGNGLHPKYYDQIIGKKAKCDISFGEPIKLEFIID